MKQITLSIILLLSVCSAFAQSNINTKSHPKTVEKLFEKYKAVEGYTYNDLTDTMKNFQVTDSESDVVTGETTKININFDDLKNAGVDVEGYLRNLEKYEMATVPLSDEERSMLNEDLKNLKGYECFTQSNFNMPESKTEGSALKEMFVEAMDFGPIRMDYYGKGNDDYIEDMLSRVDAFGTTILVHIKGKLKKYTAAMLLMQGMNDNPYNNFEISTKISNDEE